MGYDGEIRFNSRIDNSHIQKDLDRIENEIRKSQESISKNENAKLPFLKQAEALNVKLSEAKRTLEGLAADLSAAQEAMKPGASYEDFSRASADLPNLQKAIAVQEKEVAKLQKDWEKASEKVEKYDRAIQQANADIERNKARAAELSAQLNPDTIKMQKAFDKAHHSAQKFGRRLWEIGKSALIFNVISSGLRSVVQHTSKVLKTNEKYRAQLAQLNGALLTAFQPIYEFVLPGLLTVLNVLTAIVRVVASVLSALSGKTAAESAKNAKALHEEAEAIGSVGGAAKDAQKHLAGFDEINSLGTPDTGGGGGGGAGAAIEPDFSWVDGVTEELMRIADYVLLIGLGLAAWKIGNMLPGVLGTVATTFGGLVITLGGFMLMWEGVSDALENGVDWLNLTEMVGGLVAAAGGLYIAFGSVASGIALVVGGIALLLTGFSDAMESGFNLQNTLLVIAGIFATGLGITLITGSLIPALIGSIAALLLAVTIATGHGGELIEGVQEICQGFSDFIGGIFTGDIGRALGGIETMFSGLGKVIDAIILGVRDTILSFLDWLDEKTGGKLSGIIDAIKSMFIGIFDFLRDYCREGIDSLIQIFSGLTKFISGVFTGDWDMAWEGVKDIFKGLWNNIAALTEGGANLIIQGLNWLIGQMNKIRFTVPDWVPSVGGRSIGINIPSISPVSVPRLAQGAVLPANKPFLAMVGDQKSGTNVEAPLETIKQALAEVTAMHSGGETVIRFTGDLAQLGRILKPVIENEKMRTGDSLATEVFA